MMPQVSSVLTEQPTAASTTARQAVKPGQAIDLELAPVPGLRGRLNVFSATLPGGRVLVRASRQPLFDGARALLAEGVAPATVISVRHRGSRIIAMQSTTGEAAKWTVEEADRGGLRRRSWRPNPMAHSSRGGVAENGRAEVDEREHDEAGSRAQSGTTAHPNMDADRPALFAAAPHAE